MRSPRLHWWEPDLLVRSRVADRRRVRLDACVDLTRTATRQQYARALSTWGWAGVERKVPLFTSLFGDVFFESYDGYWWLDSVRGVLVKPWDTLEAMDADLESARGQGRFLRSHLALDAELRGLLPEEGQLYGFTVAPVLGGAVHVDNLELMELTLKLHLTGQLHAWVRNGG